MLNGFPSWLRLRMAKNHWACSEATWASQAA